MTAITPVYRLHAANSPPIDILPAMGSVTQIGSDEGSVLIYLDRAP